MNINATLFGQMITFAIFVWFTMRFVWPLIQKAMQERQLKITEGLAAAEKGHRLLARTEQEIAKKIEEAKMRCGKMIEEAQSQAITIVEEAKNSATKHKADSIAAANNKIEQEVGRAKEELRDKFAALVVAGVAKILQRSITIDDHKRQLAEFCDKL